MSVTIRMIGCAVAVAATASLGPGAGAAIAGLDVVLCQRGGRPFSLDLRVSGCSTVIQSGKISNSDLALAYIKRPAAGLIHHSIAE